MPKEIAFDADARSRLVRGMDTVAEAVGSTLGPRGRNVAIGRRFGAPVVTHDGVTVARQIELDDSFENMGAQLIKEASSRTNDVAGDGTTTSAVLAQAILAEGLMAVAVGANPMLLRDGIRRAADAAIADVREQARPVRDQEEIAHVATISAADESIGRIVAGAVEHVGREGAVSVEESRGLELEIERVEGMSIDRGYLSPFFMSNEERRVELEEPYILIANAALTRAADILPTLEGLPGSGPHTLLVIADDVLDEALALLVMNRLQGKLTCAAIRGPDFGDRRREGLEDIATVTGGTVISTDVGRPLSSVALDDLGRCRRAVVDKGSTILVGGPGDRERIGWRIEEAKARLGEARSDSEHRFLEGRLAALSGGVAVIKVGGATEIEIKEKCFRIEDALNATRAAMEEGTVPGGGVALLNAADALADMASDGDDEAAGIRAVRKALEAPIRRIAENAGLEGSVIVDGVRRRQRSRKNPSFGFNVVGERYVDMRKANIIDPAKVVGSALLNAASVAAMVLTVGALVAELPPEPPPEAVY